MKERPISFSAAMVQAVRRGEKTQARLIVKGLTITGPNPPHTFDVYKDGEWVGAFGLDGRGNATKLCPYGEPGDRLWVRERLMRPDGDPWLYQADNQPVMVAKEDETAMLVWAHHKQHDYSPSIHMPRWASRITLEITGVRVERVQEITEAGAKAEGAEAQPMCDVWLGDNSDPGYVTSCRHYLSYREGFKELWDSIYRKTFPWESNPWVWVVEFRRDRL